jgi:hypothetical protein
MKTILSINIFTRVINKIQRSCTAYKKNIQYFFYNKLTAFSGTKEYISMPLITIFGSCRQDSIYQLYPVTSIKNDLSYTHYTKEIIQAMGYCKSLARDFDENVFFRSSLLKNSLIGKNFAKEFNKTDLFIVEIASRIAYKYKGKFIHHEAYDNPEYRPQLNSEVDVYDLSDEEIEQDLLRIKELTYPKKLIIVTHIVTTKKGKRYDLARLIKSICLKLKIQVIEPYELINQYSKNLLFEKNDKQRHYTDFGHDIIKNEYQKAIKFELQDNQTKLIQVYSNSKRKLKLHSHQGFGDFLMGAISVNQVAKKLNFQPKVSFNNHPISNYFYNNEYVSAADLVKTRYIFNSPELIDFINGGYVFTNKKPNKVNNDDKNFIISNCLLPRIHFENYLKLTTKNLKLGNNYTVIHIRGPDEDVINQGFIKTIDKLISDHVKPNLKYLLLSNSKKILDEICRSDLIKTSLPRCHSGLSDLDNIELRDTLLEFMLMSKSEEIIQLSVYQWGSNFSNIVAELYDIPIRKYKIN